MLAKVQLGEADAGMVHCPEVTPDIVGKLQVIKFPDRYNVRASYSVALVKGSPNPAAGRQFSDICVWSLRTVEPS